ncbi:hypothetical protein E4T44_09676 [Aureobasidium sp. EXF-8845]|nr:hypothetical protein E4T44_09676 [Aureobasidium sp. EXF-8845]KAI4842010.1 hypothetical protein E4T45_09247 [Aureobasidium sp. EXF-8846]
MTLQPVLPNELMLLILKHQTTISDLLALSSTNRSMRSLFLDDASGILAAVCKNTHLLSAAKVLVDIIFEVANDQPQTCVSLHRRLFGSISNRIASSAYYLTGSQRFHAGRE